MSAADDRPSTRAAVVVDAFRSQLWPLPVLAVALAVLAGVLVPLLDARIDDSLSGPAARIWFGGGPDAARSVLTAVAGSLVTLTSLTFSLTVVTLQLASGQFSPRLLRTFNQDRYVHVTLALFLATFGYALTVLRTVRSADEDSAAEVPRIAVTLSFILALASVIALVLFLAHLAKEIRVETMLRRVHAEGRRTLERTRPERTGDDQPVALPAPPDDAVPLLAPRSGFLTSVDEQPLVEAATAAGAVLLLERPVGASLVVGTPVGWAWRASGGVPLEGDALSEAVERGLVTGHEPTGGQDITFALCQVTDVAAKALSPGVNDPRTAVHALGHSAALVVRSAARRLGPTVTCDAAGHERLFRHQPDLADLLDLAVSAPRRYGAGDPDVLGRLFALLAEVAWSSTDPRHRAAVEAQLARLVATADDQDFDEVERARLVELARTVRAALQGRHRSPAPPLLA